MIISIKPSPIGDLSTQAGRGVELEEYSNDHDATRAIILALDALHAYGYPVIDLIKAAAHIGQQLKQPQMYCPQDGVGIVSN